MSSTRGPESATEYRLRLHCPVQPDHVLGAVHATSAGHGTPAARSPRSKQDQRVAWRESYDDQTPSAADQELQIEIRASETARPGAPFDLDAWVAGALAFNGPPEDPCRSIRWVCARCDQDALTTRTMARSGRPRRHQGRITTTVILELLRAMARHGLHEVNAQLDTHSIRQRAQDVRSGDERVRKTGFVQTAGKAGNVVAGERRVEIVAGPRSRRRNGRPGRYE